MINENQHLKKSQTNQSLMFILSGEFGNYELIN